MEKFVFHLKENIKVFSCGSKLCEMEVKFQETDDLDTRNVITLKIIVSNLQYFIYRKRHRHTKRQRQRQRRRVVRDPDQRALNLRLVLANHATYQLRLGLV